MLAQLTQKFQTKILSKVLLPAVIAVGLLLTGCLNVQSNVALHGQGEWHGVQAIILSAEFVEMMESSGEGNTEFDTAELDQWLQLAESMPGSDNLNVSFNEIKGDDGSLTYLLQADGKQLETLNEILFQGKADISVAEVGGQRQITIVFDAAEGEEGAGQADQEMPAEMMEAMGITIAYRISGGEIISHNADRVEGNTAIWETPTLMEITLTEAAEFSPESIALVDPPDSSGPSLMTLLNNANQNADTPTTSSTESSTSSAPTTESPATTDTTTQDTDTSTAPTSESAEASADTTMQSADASTAPATDSADTSTEATAQSADVSAAAPAGEGEGLPASGAILPPNSSTASLIFAGLVLMALVGAGATTSLLNRK